MSGCSSPAATKTWWQRGAEVLSDRHPRLHLAGWIDQVFFSLTGAWGTVQLIISIGSIRQAGEDQRVGK
jgi:hypothetical protein